MVENIQVMQESLPQHNSMRPQQLIEPKEIKAILYMGLRGEIALPVEKHQVDILA